MFLKGRLALVVIGGFFFFLALGISQGLIKWGKDDYSCYHGRGFYDAVSAQRWMSLGKIQLYYQPKTWGCKSEERYDPRQYKMEGGLLTPI